MPQIFAFAGPPGPAFSFSAFLLPACPLACVDGAGFLSSRFAAVLDSLTAGSHWPNRAGLGLSWGRFPSRPPKPHTSHAGASLVSPPFFPSLSRWKPGKQQICVHGNLTGAQFQDENLIGKKRFSLPWLSLASPPHFFSRPPSHFSNFVLRSLFFVLCGSIFAWGCSLFLGKRKAGSNPGPRIKI